MVTFLPQARFVAPANQTANQLAALGQDVGTALRSRRQRNALEEVGRLAGEGDLAAASQAAFQGGQAGLGVNLLAQQRAAHTAGQITPFQQAQLRLQQQRINRMAEPLTFEQRLQIAQAGRAPVETTEQKARVRQRVKAEAARTELQRGGRQVLGAVSQLLTKIGNPGGTEAERAQAERFRGATGPIEGTGVGQLARSINPFSNREELTLVREIQQDAQAINTLMQRALLNGGGSITENERAQINQILGSIATAQDATQARALLGNFQQLVRSIFDMDAGGAPNSRQATGQPSASQTSLRPGQSVTLPGGAVVTREN